MKKAKPLPPALIGRSFNRADLADANVSASRLRRGDTARPFHGVHTTDPSKTPLGRCLDYAARLRPGQCFSHVTAAQVHDLPLPPALAGRRALDIAAVHPATAPETREVIGHRLRREPDLVHVDGLPVCSPEETWCQLAAMLDLVELVVVADHIVRRAALTAAPTDDEDAEAEAVRALARLRAAVDVPGRWRKVVLNRALALTRWRSASPGESRVRVILVLAGVPEPELNRTVLHEGEPLGAPDLLWRAQRVTLEYEGDGHRVDKEQFRRDIERYDAFRAAGWNVLRVTADSIRPARRKALVTRVERALGLV